MESAPLELWLGDVVRLRKPHPCGARSWQVVRLGADIGLICRGCGRRVLIDRRRLERRFEAFEERGDPAISRAVQPVAADAPARNADNGAASRGEGAAIIEKDR